MRRPGKRRDADTRDWSERAFEELERTRRSTEVGSPPPIVEPTPGVDEVRRRSPWKWTVGLLAVIVVLFLIRATRHTSYPALAANCQTAGLALSTTSVSHGGEVRWRATGPTSARYLLTIGVAALKPGAKPGELSPVPQAGHTIKATQLANATGTLDTDCTAHGLFSAEVPSGTYLVRLFAIRGTGTATVGTPAATQPLTVK